MLKLVSVPEKRKVENMVTFFLKTLEGFREQISHLMSKTDLLGETLVKSRMTGM